MNEMTREGATMKSWKMTDDDRCHWWWMFSIYGADDATRIMNGWIDNSRR